MSAPAYRVLQRKPGEVASEGRWHDLVMFGKGGMRIDGQPHLLKGHVPERLSDDEIQVNNVGKPFLLKFESAAEMEQFLRDLAVRGQKRKEPPAAVAEGADAEQATSPGIGVRRPGCDVSDEYGSLSKGRTLPTEGKQMKMGALTWSSVPLAAAMSVDPLKATVLTSPSPQRHFNFGGGGGSKTRLPGRQMFSAPPQRSQSYSSCREQQAFREVAMKEHGLRNLGNTCYLNAVAQSLSSLREFAATLRSMPQVLSAMGKGELFSRTTELLERMSSQVPGQGPISPTQLRERIAQQAPMFGGRGQQDAHEFFLEWVNQLHDEMLAASEQWAREDPALFDERAEKQRGLALATQQHFDSEVQKRLVCETCGDHRDVCERFRDFSLDFESGQDSPLQFMLKSYFAEERLEAKCERCGGSRARMTKTLTGAPRVLVLHLKRFVPNTSKQCYEKQHGSVFIPSELDIAQCIGACSAVSASPAASPTRLPARPLAAEGAPPAPPATSAPAPAPVGLSETPPPRASGADVEAGGPITPPPPAAVAVRGQATSAQEPKESLQDGSLLYDLRAVVAHEGSSPHQGHYVSYARSEKGAWRLYDDAQVKDVGSDPTAELGRRAYILFYVLRGAARA